MEAFLGRFGELIDWLVSYVPSLIVVDKKSAGIKYPGGARHVVMNPGMHMHVPATTPYDVIPVVRQRLEIESQALTTKDGKSIYVDGMIIFSIHNIAQFIVENYDAMDSLSEIALGAIGDLVSDMTWAKIKSERHEFNKKLRAAVSGELRKDFGVTVEKVRLKSSTEAKVLHHVGEGMGLGDYEDDEEYE